MNKAYWQMALLGCGLLGCSAGAHDEAGEQTDGLFSESAKVVWPASDISAAGLDCTSFNGYTAALATSTVDCLGTLRPDSFKVTAEGLLARNFSSCSVDATRLADIDALLSLQQRSALLPHVKECIAGHYADFSREFSSKGVLSCPTWSKKQTVNPISPAVIDALTPNLDQLGDALQAADKGAGKARALTANGVPEELEEKNIYSTSFPESASPQARESAAAWAAACAGGFAGFVLGTAGSSVLTDPTAWLIDTTYGSAAQDPYFRPGYYHPMSYYGPIPGALFGNANRYRPCPTCKPEICSYYAGSHLKTFLQLDCLDDNNWATCVSYCGPPLP